MILSFYVRKVPPTVLPSIITSDNTTENNKNGLYPMNILRDMAIESIETTHYVLIDIDILISSTLRQDISRNRVLLDDNYNILLLPLFVVARTEEVQRCRSSGFCLHM